MLKQRSRIYTLTIGYQGYYCYKQYIKILMLNVLSFNEEDSLDLLTLYSVIHSKSHAGRWEMFQLQGALAA